MQSYTMSESTTSSTEGDSDSDSSNSSNQTESESNPQQPDGEMAPIAETPPVVTPPSPLPPEPEPLPAPPPVVEIPPPPAPVPEENTDEVQLTDEVLASARLATGSHHTCAINIENKLFCWGRAWEGQLGDGQKSQNKNQPVHIMQSLTFTSVDVGTQSSCAITMAGKLYCWGLNKHYELGYDGSKVATPTEVTGFPENDSLILIKMSNSFNMFKDHVSLNHEPAHSCALTQKGRIFCWGDNKFGQLGVGNQTSYSMKPLAVAKDLRFVDLVVGAAHSCAKEKLSGAYYCWGSNHRKQIALSSSSNIQYLPSKFKHSRSIQNISLGGAFTCFIDSSESIYCIGKNSKYELGRGVKSEQESNLSPVKGLENKGAQVIAGHLSACAIDLDDDIHCWGDNYSGEMGLGSIGGTQTIPKNLLLSKASLTADFGMGHVCAAMTDGKLLCWGHGYFGELGTKKDKANYPTPSQVVGFEF